MSKNKHKNNRDVRIEKLARSHDWYISSNGDWRDSCGNLLLDTNGIVWYCVCPAIIPITFHSESDALIYALFLREVWLA